MKQTIVAGLILFGVLGLTARAQRSERLSLSGTVWTVHPNEVLTVMVSR